MKWSNQRIRVEVFWEHALSIGPFRSFSVWARKPGVLKAQFELYEVLARRSLEAMLVGWEREEVGRLAKRRFNGRLTPGPAEVFGNKELLVSNLERLVSESTLIEWHAQLDSYYGTPRATQVRLGKDVAQYSGPLGLLSSSIQWHLQEYDSSEEATWSHHLDGRQLEVHMQEFPFRRLYRLELESVVIWEFDDWPRCWQRNETKTGHPSKRSARS